MMGKNLGVLYQSGLLPATILSGFRPRAKSGLFAPKKYKDRAKMNTKPSD